MKSTAAALLVLLLQDEAQIYANERKLVESLQRVAAAEVAFRADRKEYWVADLSGLHRCINPETQKPIELIDLALAQADADPVKDRQNLADKAVPLFGYLIRAVAEYEDTGDAISVYDRGKGTHPDRFAFCACPAEPGKTGRHTFLVTESLKVWWKDTEGKRVARVPLDLAKDGWKADPIPEPADTPAAKKWQCEHNLKQIAKLIVYYQENSGGDHDEMPSVTGKSFMGALWALADEKDHRFFVCPFTKAEEGSITYRGPKSDVNVEKNYTPEDAIVCDKLDNHPDGTIHALTRELKVRELRKDTEAYQRAVEHTKD